MSIQAPAKLCQPNNGFLARITCYMQSKAEWLCTKEEPELNQEKRFGLSEQYLSMPTCGGIYKLAHDLCFQDPEFQRQALAKYMRECPQLVVSEWVHTTLAPIIPRRAKIAMAFWKAFSYGTDCHCCLSYRIITLVAASFAIGLAL